MIEVNTFDAEKEGTRTYYSNLFLQSPLFCFVLSKLYAHCGAQIHNPRIKSCMLFQLSLPGTPIKSFTHSCDKDKRYCVLHTAGYREHSAGQAVREPHFQAISSHMGNADKEAVT